MRNKILIVEGGGAEGLFALGIIDYLINEQNHKYKALFGTSIGAAISVGLACNYTDTKDWCESVTKLCHQMEQLSKWDLIKYPTLFGFFKGGYLVSNIKKTVNSLFTADRTFDDLKIKCGVMVTDYDAKNPVKYIDTEYRLDDAIAMSANIPGVFSYYKDPINGHRCFDGGVACNEPIAEAAKHMDGIDAEYIVIRMGNYKPAKKRLTATGAILQGFTIARYEIEQLSIKLSKKYTNKVTVIQVPFELGLLEFNPKTNSKHITEGYEYAKRCYTNNANG